MGINIATSDSEIETTVKATPLTVPVDIHFVQRHDMALSGQG